MKLVIVTATSNPTKAEECVNSWLDRATTSPALIMITNNWAEENDPAEERILRRAKLGHVTRFTNYLGTVDAFRQGTDEALGTGADIVACLHDDFAIHEPGWDDKVLEHFRRHPKCGLLGFGGAIGLGAASIYQTPYNPMQLARIGFRSNLVDAEVHGIRSTLAERVACLDGFSQIGRREFWLGDRPNPVIVTTTEPLWTQMLHRGIVHHMYDGVLGALAARNGWDTWYLPLRGKHYGGRTAVGDSGYQTWAQAQISGGDQGFWEQSHKAAYEWLRDVLPLRV